MIKKLAAEFGPGSRDQRTNATITSIAGAYAALETFYYSFNHRDIDALGAVWEHHPLAQLNNPLGGMVCGGNRILDLYSTVFNAATRVQVTFSDITEYSGNGYAIFVGRETGAYTTAAAQPAPLNIRTSRFFTYSRPRHRWVQLHHHGSIDDPTSLSAYQEAIKAAPPK